MATFQYARSQAQYWWSISKRELIPNFEAQASKTIATNMKIRKAKENSKQI
jgi:hypothetical protein